MAQERIIHQHQSYAEGGHHQHPGMHSIRRGLDAAEAKIREWRQERVASHERGVGHEDLDPAMNPRWDYIEGEDQEIVLMKPAEEHTPKPTESLVVGFLAPDVSLQRQIAASHDKARSDQ